MLRLDIFAILALGTYALRPNQDELASSSSSRIEALVQPASMPSDLAQSKIRENSTVPYNLDDAYLKVHRILGRQGTWQDPAAWKAVYDDCKTILGVAADSRMKGLVDLLAEIAQIVSDMHRDFQWLEYYCQWRMVDDATREMISIVEKYMRWDDIDNDEQGKLVKAMVRLSIRGSRDRQSLVQYFVYQCYKFPLFGQRFSGYYNDVKKMAAPIAGHTSEIFPDPKSLGAHIFRLARSFDATAFTELLQASVPVLERVLGEGDDRVFVPDFILSAQEKLLALPTPESIKARFLGFKRKKITR